MMTVVSPDLERLALGAKVFPKPLRASMRKELTAIGRTAAAASKAKIEEMPSQGGTARGSRLARFDQNKFSAGPGLRASIAASIKVSATANTASGVGLSIRVPRGGELAANRRFRVAQLLDRGKPFPHKVYGRWTDPLVMVQPYSYFNDVIELSAPAMRAAAASAIKAATLASIPNVR